MEGFVKAQSGKKGLVWHLLGTDSILNTIQIVFNQKISSPRFAVEAG